MSARLERLIELGLNVVITEDPSIFSEEAREAGDELLRLAAKMWDECEANGDGGGGGGLGVKKFGPVPAGAMRKLFKNRLGDENDSSELDTPEVRAEVCAEVGALNEDKSAEVDVSMSPAVNDMLGELAKQSATAASSVGEPAAKKGDNPRVEPASRTRESLIQPASRTYPKLSRPSSRVAGKKRAPTEEKNKPQKKKAGGKGKGKALPSDTEEEEMVYEEAGEEDDGKEDDDVLADLNWVSGFEPRLQPRLFALTPALIHARVRGRSRALFTTKGSISTSRSCPTSSTRMARPTPSRSCRTASSRSTRCRRHSTRLARASWSPRNSSPSRTCLTTTAPRSKGAPHHTRGARAPHPAPRNVLALDSCLETCLPVRVSGSWLTCSPRMWTRATRPSTSSCSATRRTSHTTWTRTPTSTRIRSISTSRTTTC